MRHGEKRNCVSKSGHAAFFHDTCPVCLYCSDTKIEFNGCGFIALVQFKGAKNVEFSLGQFLKASFGTVFLLL